jgi:hypothetical protein
MLCQTCRRNVALVRARIGSNTVHICIPCAIALMDSDKDITLELEKWGVNVQEKQKKEEQEQED